jgi:hypothetical protein
VLAVFGMGVLLILGYIKALIVEQNKRYNVTKKNSEKHILFDELTGLPNTDK